MIESKKDGGGTELINRILSDAKNENIKRITLTTSVNTGLEFFKKMGFEEMGDDNDPLDIPMFLDIK